MRRFEKPDDLSDQADHDHDHAAHDHHAAHDDHHADDHDHDDQHDALDHDQDDQHDAHDHNDTHDHTYDHRAASSRLHRLGHGLSELVGTHSHDSADQVDHVLEADAAGR